MKTFVFVVIFLVVIQSCSSNEVPESVRQKFLDMEPSANDLEWADNGDMYRVYYKLDGQKVTSYFDYFGQWMETETEITVQELRTEVLNVLQTKFVDYSIIDIEIVRTSDGQELYEIDLDKAGKTYDILFDTTGQILRKKI